MHTVGFRVRGSKQYRHLPAHIQPCSSRGGRPQPADKREKGDEAAGDPTFCWLRPGTSQGDARGHMAVTGSQGMPSTEHGPGDSWGPGKEVESWDDMRAPPLRTSCAEGPAHNAAQQRPRRAGAHTTGSSLPQSEDSHTGKTGHQVGTPSVVPPLAWFWTL